MLNRPALRLFAAQHQFVFDPAAQPALIVDPGQTIIIETLDCFCGRLTADSPPLHDDKDVLAHIGGRYNPVNQPIFVRGAEPGDTLEVEILDIELGKRQPFAVTHVAHDWAFRFGGAAFAGAVAPATIIAEIDGPRIRLPVAGRIIDFAARPMIGTIGTAPTSEAVSSLLYGSGHGGNLDCPAIGPGVTILLPVNVPGALLSLGDIHALMGDGEITGTAMESSADVAVRVSVRKGRDILTTPRLEDTASRGSIGCASGSSLQDNIQSAVLDLSASLQEDLGLSCRDALQLINLFGKIVVNQAVSADTNRWASVFVAIEKANLPL